MIKLLTIIGARPQIIKAAALSRAIKNHFSNEIEEVLVHTGQHYDDNMSAVFFRELGIPDPHYNLQVGSGAHGKQTAQMIQGIEDILLKEKPFAIVLYGDTNSTLAGAIAASKLLVPVIHIEAGLRSFNKSMPEEINRIMCDHVSTLLFSPTDSGVENLKKEGFSYIPGRPAGPDNPLVFHCGDVMYDNSMYFSDVAEKNTRIMDSLGLEKENFVLCTIHRNQNTDEPKRLTALFDSFDVLSRESGLKFIIPLHPRTSKLLESNLDKAVYENVMANPLITIIPPVSFLEMIALEKNSALIMTDSGGVQKEAYFFRKACVILRPETEWVELVKAGTAVIADADPDRIKEGFRKFIAERSLDFPALYGDGRAAEFICREIIELFKFKEIPKGENITS